MNNEKLHTVPTLAWRKIERNTYIIDTATNMLHELNETGSTIWKLIVAGKTPLQIAEMLTAEYDVNPDEAKKDVFTLIDTLLKKGVLLKKPS